jgi:hypothetical protein
VSEAPGHGGSGRHWAALALGMAAWVLREAAGRRAFPAARITGIREGRTSHMWEFVACEGALGRDHGWAARIALIVRPRSGRCALQFIARAITRIWGL